MVGFASWEIKVGRLATCFGRTALPSRQWRGARMRSAAWNVYGRSEKALRQPSRSGLLSQAGQGRAEAEGRSQNSAARIKQQIPLPSPEFGMSGGVGKRSLTRTLLHKDAALLIAVPPGRLNQAGGRC